ncbi:MAG: nitrite/sulfite reductase [Saccharospirillaceae bacterium]|nr:nitrite/sulfite reductase [Pseudomonadales bacterium]NRB80033.1 nitrite/sulfite reductase [Saccharospirillaceae bacterium]
MYIYDQYDQTIIDERVAQFREQTNRFLNGELTNDEFLPLRLQNGLYVQRHAPMLRIAVPYGLISSNQMRAIADITEKYDKGYAHFSTRQNIQLNWPALESVPDILADLAKVQMHAVQTSGNCIRSTTSDQFAGVAKNEIEDPRPWAEIIRQWSTFHPEFAYLPRKFKIAVNGATDADRAAIRMHDIGVQLVKNDQGEVGFQIFVGGGLGRTPILGEVLEEFLEQKHLLTYLDSIVRVYNLKGRRDNKYKARIKILVKAMGVDAFKVLVLEQFDAIKDGEGTLTQTEIDRVKAYFVSPDYADLPQSDAIVDQLLAENKGFKNWVTRNTQEHRQAGYVSVNLSFKKVGYAPGDATAKQLRASAQLAQDFGFDEMRITHFQNVVLPDVKISQLPALWEETKKHGLATPTIGTLTDVICCPGGDFCALANAKSLPIAEQILSKFDDLDYLYELGDIDLNISGCMNACGHHHIGNIGVLGVDKKGEEFYQISLGGSSGKDASVGKILGPSFKADDMGEIISKIIDVFVEKRQTEELFIDCVRRVGLDPFKERVYAKSN